MRDGLAWRWVLSHAAALSIASLLPHGILSYAPRAVPVYVLLSLGFGLPLAWIQASNLHVKRFGWIPATILGFLLGFTATRGFEASLRAAYDIRFPSAYSAPIRWTVFVLRQMTAGILLGLVQGTALKLMRAKTGAARWGFWTSVAWGSAGIFHVLLLEKAAYQGPLYGVSDTFRSFLASMPQGAVYGLLLLPALKRDAPAPR